MLSTSSRYVMVLGLLVLGGSGCGGAQPSSTPGYAVLIHKDHVFKCDYPSDWVVDYTPVGFPDMTRVIFIEKPIDGRIQCMSQPRAKFEGSKNPLDIDAFHEKTRTHFTSHFDKYDEQAPTELKANAWQGRMSVFDGTIGTTSLKGIRATLLNSQWRITVMCDCKPETWEAHRAVFEHVLGSVADVNK